uniref:Uncharacterized protein n=1 Tax=Manihot esculenta TaxID=3983 RepID=A0A2C9VN10_MANES
MNHAHIEPTVEPESQISTQTRIESSPSQEFSGIPTSPSLALPQLIPGLQMLVKLSMTIRVEDKIQVKTSNSNPKTTQESNILIGKEENERVQTTKHAQPIPGSRPKSPTEIQGEGHDIAMEPQEEGKFALQLELSIDSHHPRQQSVEKKI